MIAIILASDKTQLSTHSGNVKAWPVYLSIGNIEVNVRKTTSKRAWILVAKVPVHPFSKTEFNTGERMKTMAGRMPGILSQKLFHKCMSIPLSKLRSD